MDSDRDFDLQAAQRARGRRVAWLVVSLAIGSTVVTFGAMPIGTRVLKAPDHQTPLPQQWTPVDSTSLSDGVNWDAVVVAEDPSPLSVAAYER